MLFKGLSWFSFFGDTGFLEEQKCRMKTAFLHISAQSYIYILLHHDPTHTAAKPYTMKGFV